MSTSIGPWPMEVNGSWFWPIFPLPQRLRQFVVLKWSWIGSDKLVATRWIIISLSSWYAMLNLYPQAFTFTNKSFLQVFENGNLIFDNYWWFQLLINQVDWQSLSCSTSNRVSPFVSCLSDNFLYQTVDLPLSNIMVTIILPFSIL